MSSINSTIIISFSFVVIWSFELSYGVDDWLANSDVDDTPSNLFIHG